MLEPPKKPGKKPEKELRAKGKEPGKKLRLKGKEPGKKLRLKGKEPGNELRANTLGRANAAGPAEKPTGRKALTRLRPAEGNEGALTATRPGLMLRNCPKPAAGVRSTAASKAVPAIQCLFMGCPFRKKRSGPGRRQPPHAGPCFYSTQRYRSERPHCPDWGKKTRWRWKATRHGKPTPSRLTGRVASAGVQERPAADAGTSTVVPRRQGRR